MRTPRGIFIFSNHDRPIAIEDGDRRFFVIRVQAEQRDPAYYERLGTEGLSEPVIAAFKHHLVTYDLTGFKPKAKPPMTEAKQELITSIHSNLEQQLGWLRENKAWPFDRDVYLMEDVRTALQQYSRQPTTDRKFAKLLQALGDKKLKNRPLIQKFGDLQRRHVWVWRNQEHWRYATPDQIKAELLQRPTGGVDSHLRLVDAVDG